MNDIRIRCPKCKWQPDGGPHWQCTCGCQWNTFDTGARCPACGKVWQYTQCVDPLIGGCERISPHLDWYDGLDDVVRELEREWAEVGVGR
jgi:hypothetical protein